MKVKLSGYEMMLTVLAGGMRQVEAIRRAREDNHGFVGDGWGIHIEGAGAELAVAKAAGLFWEAVVKNPLGLAGDVGPIQVRSTQRANGRLILHKSDPAESLFILVTGRIPEFTIVGAIPGEQGMKDSYWTDPKEGRPAYFVPQEALKPLEEFNLTPAPLAEAA